MENTQLGYNTNGFAHHTLDDAIEIIAEAGYRCVALTLDVHHCNPWTVSHRELAALRKRLKGLGLACVIETGARYLLNPRHKHRPTLLDEDARLRRKFLARAMDIAAELEARCVSYWSGARPVDGTLNDGALLDRLARAVGELESEAQQRNIVLGFEPEPGFFIESMADYDRLCAKVGKRLGLTLDIGHLQCIERAAPAEILPQYADATVNIQLDDMRKGEHRHLMFGQGEVDFPGVFEALRLTGYKGFACVELSESSRTAVQTAHDSYEFLRRFVP